VLELWAGSNIVGNAVAAPVVNGSSTLTLGGAGNGSFDLTGIGTKYQGFTAFAKTGLSTWTLSGAASSFDGDTTVDAGTLRFGAGASLTSRNASIADQTGSTADVVIGAAGATWNVDGHVFVGNQGAGSLTLASGGRMRVFTIDVGANSGGSGTIAVADAGSHLDVNTLTLGEAGSGTLRVLNGGSVSATFVEVGDIAPGSSLVSGSGSKLTASVLQVGLSSTGALTVADGASVGSGENRIIDVALNAGSTGTITIGAQAGSAAVAPGTLTSDIRFGAGAGTLTFNHDSSDYTFSRRVTGAGTISFTSGRTLLTGDSAGFSGTATVAGSTLAMTHDARLGGSLAINAGGRVEGAGQIGATTINSGGTLAPEGSTSLTVDGPLTVNSGGTVTLGEAPSLIVNGTLTLGNGSAFNYLLPGSAAGMPSKGSSTTRVTGDLVLAGATLNLDLPAGTGQPDIGYHRVMTYTGALSGAGLIMGATPTTSPIAYVYGVDTSLAGKVDLLVRPNGLNILQLWGTTSAGAGSGVWNGANQNWLDLGGPVPTGWGSGYGIFRGPGGTVSVQNQQSLVGLQFAGGSYTLVSDGGTPGSLFLHGFSSPNYTVTVPEIRVLADETATIGLPIAGTDGFGKTGDGTLVLNGANSYSGGTTIAGGTLQILADNSLGAASGGLTFDNGQLHTTADIVSARNVSFSNAGALDTDTATTLRINGALSGSGGLIKWGEGTLALSGANSWSGGTLIAAGTLRAQSAGALPGMSDFVLTGGLLDLNSHDLDMRLLAGSGGEIALGTARLTVNQADDSLFAGAITGSGHLVKDGAGTLLLTGTNSYAGGTTIRAGTLAIISDANLGYAASPVAFVNGGRLATFADIGSARAITLSGSGTIDTMIGTSLVAGGPITGAGALVKEGWGTLKLTGDATHSGGTTISAGMLQIGNGGTSGTLAGNVVNNGILSFNRSDSLTFAGTISGSGSLVQAGSGTTILTGTNTYAGGTVIAGGVLQASADANLGGAGTVIGFSGGTLRFGAAFDTARPLILAGNGTVDTNGFDTRMSGGVYGFGDLIKAGAGALTLDGFSLYRNTVVQAGTIIGDASSIRGDIANNGAVILNQRSDASMAGVISGAGSLTKAGAGFLELTGNSAGFSGSTTVSSGTLSVNGALGGRLDIMAGARLQGSGTVGSTTIASGAVIAPGNSIGTLSVAGDINLARGASYEVETSPEGTASDLIHASGVARLAGGSAIHIGEEGFYKPYWSYRIVTAEQGIQGRFDEAVSRFLFLDPTLQYDATNVTLTLVRNDLPFTAIANTRNQFQTGLAIERLDFANPLWERFTQLRDQDVARQAYDTLSGEIHASTKTVLIEGSQAVRDAIGDRIRSVFDGIGAPRIATLAYASSKAETAAVPDSAPAIWARGFGSWGRTGGDGNAASLSRSTGGIIAGGDVALAETWRIGLSAGYSRSTYSVPGRASSGEADNYHLGLYGGTRLGRLRFGGGLSITGHDITTRRTVAFPGFAETPTADYSARTLQAFGEIGYRFDGAPVAIEPFAGLAHVSLSTGTVSETGDLSALSAAPQTTAVTLGTLGVRTEMEFDIGGAAAKLKSMLGWRYAAGDVTPVSLQAFSGGTPFSIAAVPIARNAVMVGAGLDVNIGNGATVGLSYSGQLARRTNDHSFDARLAVQF